MRILTINAGSTSVKIERFDLDGALPPLVDAPPLAADRRTPGPDADAAIARAARGVDVVAHRFVRLPDPDAAVVPIDAKLRTALAGVESDAPLHDAPALAAADVVAGAAPGVLQLAVSDSAFHRTMPEPARTYAIPRELTRRGLRRLGFHGLSHQYAAHRACALARADVRRARVVTAHLGGGSSLCAIARGASVDTTMGYTPLEGLPMATRSGSVDPGLLLHLLRGGMTVDELDATLERRSGLLGVSGRSGDLRTLLRERDPDARLAVDVLCWRLRAAVGAMIGVLGDVDMLVFTGGIGENVPRVREAGANGAWAAGARIDPARNGGIAREGCVSRAASPVGVYVVAARENWQLARMAYAHVEPAFATPSSAADGASVG
ncbi:MAG TPA: hypothetical protein VFB22_10425 [Candidatus Baltobacteraceae bacterium]|nr:hypothetical protein [Candidatus Baltobacteraceae bacterium]